VLDGHDLTLFLQIASLAAALGATYGIIKSDGKHTRELMEAHRKSLHDKIAVVGKSADEAHTRMDAHLQAHR